MDVCSRRKARKAAEIGRQMGLIGVAKGSSEIGQGTRYRTAAQHGVETAELKPQLRADTEFLDKTLVESPSR
jgi:hypothetical protein